jgi:hypothetical protein
MAGGESTNDASVEESSDERQRLAANTNEDQLDDDVKAHSISDSGADDDAPERDKLASNTNEDAAEDD